LPHRGKDHFALAKYHFLRLAKNITQKKLSVAKIRNGQSFFAIKTLLNVKRRFSND